MKKKLAGLRIPRNYAEVGLYIVLGLIGYIAVFVTGNNIIFGIIVLVILWAEALAGFIVLLTERKKKKPE